MLYITSVRPAKPNSNYCERQRYRDNPIDPELAAYRLPRLDIPGENGHGEERRYKRTRQEEHCDRRYLESLEELAFEEIQVKVTAASSVDEGPIVPTVIRTAFIEVLSLVAC